MNSTSSNEIRPIEESRHQKLSSFAIGMIIISVIAGIGFISFLVYFLVRQKKKQKNSPDMEQREQQETNNGDNVIKKLFHTSSSSRNSNNNRPATSSLDSPDLFSTLLKYPPTQPQIVLSNNSNQCYQHPGLLTVPSFFENTASSLRNSDVSSKTMDAVSISLARQSLEERSGYYRSPNRKPVPYYKHQHYHSAVFTSAVTGGSSSSSGDHSNERLATSITGNDEDEDTKMMKSWSDSSYKVW